MYLKRGTYFARLVLSTRNELKQRAMIEIDARPQRLYRDGDTAKRAPICVSRDVWDRVEDMTDALGKMRLRREAAQHGESQLGQHAAAGHHMAELIPDDTNV
jgi:bifunctional DNase/RNase